jgi:toxin-antitoxin system PIN domain toxin
MDLPDVNVLIYAFREGAPNHLAFRRWLEETITAESAFGLSDLVLSAFLRIITNQRIFNPAEPLDTALAFVDGLRSQPNCVIVTPGPRHWPIFTDLCRNANARGNLIPDAYLAALAIESGCELISRDRDFGRFAGLRWRPPF